MKVVHNSWPGYKAMWFLLITTRDQVSEFVSDLDSYLCLKNARHSCKAKVTYSKARCNCSIDAKVYIATCCFHVMQSQKHFIPTGSIAEAPVVLFLVVCIDWLSLWLLEVGTAFVPTKDIIQPMKHQMQAPGLDFQFIAASGGHASTLKSPVPFLMTAHISRGIPRHYCQGQWLRLCDSLFLKLEIDRDPSDAKLPIRKSVLKCQISNVV